MKKNSNWPIKPSFLKLSVMLMSLLPAGLVKAQTGSQGQPYTFTEINPGTFGDNAGHWYGIFDKNNIINARPGRPKYKPTEITNIADNILLFQKDNGGWPKKL